MIHCCDLSGFPELLIVLTTAIDSEYLRRQLLIGWLLNAAFSLIEEFSYPGIWTNQELRLPVFFLKLCFFSLSVRSDPALLCLRLTCAALRCRALP